MPNITGEINGFYGAGLIGGAENVGGTPSGAFYSTSKQAIMNVDDGARIAGTGFSASRSSAVYGKSTTVQPPALTMRYIVKY